MVTTSNLFECSVCGKSFAHKSSLFRHRTKKHYSPKYVCSICKKSYQYKARLARHPFTVHSLKEQREEIDEGPAQVEEPANEHILSKYTAISDSVVRYEFKLEGRSQVDLNFAELDLLPHLQDICEYLYRKWRGMKGSLYCAVLLSKPTPTSAKPEETI